MGCSRNDIDALERWKNNCRMVGTYIANTIHYPDARVVAQLFVGGALKHGLRDSSKIDSIFLLKHVCPSLSLAFPR